MEKVKANAYFIYKISYERSLPLGVPIYNFGDDPAYSKPIGYTREHIMEDRTVLPRDFETKEEAELVKEELEKIGLFRDYRVERILDHIEFLNEESAE